MEQPMAAQILRPTGINSAHAGALDALTAQRRAAVARWRTSHFCALCVV